MATTEAKLINSVCQNKDIGVLLTQGVDELFTGFPDVWQFMKEYYTKYRAVPGAEILEENFKYFDKIEVPGETVYYMDQLRGEYLNNRLEQITLKLRDNVGKIAPDDVIDKSITSLLKLKSVSVVSKDIDITDTDAAAERYAETRRKALERGGVPGIPTGVDFIDATYTSGLAGGDLVVVLGWTGMGKSLLTTMLACNAFYYGYRPMIISLEMSVEKVQDRAYTMMGNGLFKNSDLAVGDINEDDFRTWSSNMNKGKGFTVVSNDGVNEVTPTMVQAKIDKYKPDIVILDYAQLMSDNNNSGDMTARMRNMSREFKALAVANDIPIILISSATPDSSASIKTAPIIEQVAWSKQLSYDADLAIAVHMNPEFTMAGWVIMEIVCRKNRNGELFTGYFKANINEGIYKSFFNVEDMAQI